MAVYKAPIKDIQFVLNEVLDVSSLAKLPGYEEATPGYHPRHLRGGRQALRERAVSAEPYRRRRGYHYENGVVRTPDGFKEAYKQFAEALDGRDLRSMKEAIQRKFKRDNKLDYALDEIMVSNGSRQIMYDALQASVNPGDEVIIPAPGWISYADQATLAGAQPVSVSCPENNHFKLRAVDLEAAITPKTKWVVLNFPNNPTGAVCSRAEMHEIADVLLAHPHVFVMSDDVYEHLTYDGFGFCTVAEVEPKLKERTLTVNGASKAYAMTGLARRLLPAGRSP